MTESNYQKFAVQKLGLTFNKPEILMNAFTHRSYINEHKKSAKQHNERLEFLGDAVLELVTTEFLYNKFDEPEGVLTNWRSALVRTESISAAASRLNFESMLRLSRGEKHGTQRARAQILANTYEAVIGAIYLDQGYDLASRFIHQSLLSTFDDILKSGSWMDPKSRLQELAQSQVGQTPHYKVITEKGPDHDKTFEVGVEVGGQMLGKGRGPSKQAAQIAAAEEALNHYQ